MELTATQRELLNGAEGEAPALAMRILRAMGEAMDAPRLVPVESAHVDGCLLHGESGVRFAEKLVRMEGRVRVPTSLNVGAMDLRRPDNVHLGARRRSLAVRQMNAYVAMGCAPTWTCAPYQAGYRPAAGAHVAWAESNAVVFANSVLGARTNRYGDFMDICCALTGYAPETGLHLDENRRATLLVDLRRIPLEVLREEAFYPVLGAWLGREAGRDVAVIDGIPVDVDEDRLKALGAAAASTGSVALFHVAGVTPEAPTVEAALAGAQPHRRIEMTEQMLRTERDRLSTVTSDRLDVIAVGSPHFSYAEFEQLIRLFDGRKSRLPFHACTGRHVIERLERAGWLPRLQAAGVNLVADTCVVVTAIIPESAGVMMTNSGKFAHYSKPLIGHEVVFGSLADCVESAVAGRVRRHPAGWGRRP